MGRGLGEGAWKRSQMDNHGGNACSVGDPFPASSHSFLLVISQPRAVHVPGTGCVEGQRRICLRFGHQHSRPSRARRRDCKQETRQTANSPGEAAPGQRDRLGRVLGSKAGLQWVREGKGSLTAGGGLRKVGSGDLGRALELPGGRAMASFRKATGSERQKWDGTTPRPGPELSSLLPGAQIPTDTELTSPGPPHPSLLARGAEISGSQLYKRVSPSPPNAVLPILLIKN